MLNCIYFFFSFVAKYYRLPKNLRITRSTSRAFEKMNDKVLQESLADFQIATVSEDKSQRQEKDILLKIVKKDTLAKKASDSSNTNISIKGGQEFDKARAAEKKLSVQSKSTTLKADLKRAHQNSFTYQQRKSSTSSDITEEYYGEDITLAEYSQFAKQL